MQSSVGLLVLIECQYRSDLSAFTNKNSECKHSGLRSRLGCRQKIHNYFRFLPTEYNKQSFYANIGHVSTCSWWLVWSVCLSYCWILANSVLLLCFQQSAVSRGLCLLCLAATLSKLSHFLWSHRPNRTETLLLIRLFVCTYSCQLWATSFVTSVLCIIIIEFFHKKRVHCRTPCI